MLELYFMQTLDSILLWFLRGFVLGLCTYLDKFSFMRLSYGRAIRKRRDEKTLGYECEVFRVARGRKGIG